VSRTSSIVSLQNVGLRYGKGREVLRDINLELTPGSFHFLTGPSGAGKTSLLRLLFLTKKPTRGLISMFGHDMMSLSRRRLPKIRRKIGVVFQDFRLLDHLTVYENIALPLRVVGQKPKDYRENVHELLNWVGLADYADVYPPVLSGGEQQRVAIARAVISQPDLLLADEPTGNVDPVMAQRLLGLFGGLNKTGTTIVIATHDSNLIAKSKNPVLVLNDGQLGYA